VRWSGPAASMIRLSRSGSASSARTSAGASRPAADSHSPALTGLTDQPATRDGSAGG
jgi:hypothetical protein